MPPIVACERHTPALSHEVLERHRGGTSRSSPVQPGFVSRETCSGSGGQPSTAGLPAGQGEPVSSREMKHTRLVAVSGHSALQVTRDNDGAAGNERGRSTAIHLARRTQLNGNGKRWPRRGRLCGHGLQPPPRGRHRRTVRRPRASWPGSGESAHIGLDAALPAQIRHRSAGWRELRRGGSSMWGQTRAVSRWSSAISPRPSDSTRRGLDRVTHWCSWRRGGGLLVAPLGWLRRQPGDDTGAWTWCRRASWSTRCSSTAAQTSLPRASHRC